MPNSILRKGLVLAVIVLFIGMSIAPSTGINVIIEKPSTSYFSDNTLYVGGSGEGNYTKIQYAIDNASDGDTVFVYNGVYYENVNIYKSIKLIGEDKETTKIIRPWYGDTVAITTDYITLSGFYIISSGIEIGDAGIDMSNNNPEYNTIIGNIIYNSNRYGIYLKNSHYNNIKDNIIKENGREGIYLTNSHHNIIKDNSILNNDYHREGIFAGNDADFNTFENNTIYGNDFYFEGHINDNIITNNQLHHGGLILCGDINNNLFSNNSINEGIISGTNGVTNNIIDNNTINTGLISLINTNNNKISNNNLLSGYLYLNSAVGETIVNNVFYRGILVRGGHDSWTTHVIENNTAQGKPILYILDGYENVIEGDYAQVILANCNYCTVENFNFENVICGIQIGYSSGNNIYQNNISNCYENGIEISGASNINEIFGNTIENNGKNGILIYSEPKNNHILENVINNNNVGILVSGARGNTFELNEIKYNYGGIYLYGAKRHNIVSNNISKNRQYGVYLESSSENSICSNNFSKNREDDAFFRAEKKIHTNNNWNGNYWDNWNGIVPKRIEGLIKTIFFYYDDWGTIIYYYRICYNYDWDPKEFIYNLNNVESQHTSQSQRSCQSVTEEFIYERINENLQQTTQQTIRSNFLNRLIRR